MYTSTTATTDGTAEETTTTNEGSDDDDDDSVNLNGFSFYEQQYRLTDSSVPLWVVETFDVRSSYRFFKPIEFNTIKVGIKTNIVGFVDFDNAIASYFKLWVAVSYSGYDLYTWWSSLEVCNGDLIGNLAQAVGLIYWGPSYASYGEEEEFIVLEFSLTGTAYFEEGSQYSVLFWADFSDLEEVNEGDYISFYKIEDESTFSEGNVAFDGNQGSCDGDFSVIDYFENEIVYMEFNFTEDETTQTPILSPIPYTTEMPVTMDVPTQSPVREGTIDAPTRSPTFEGTLFF